MSQVRPIERLSQGGKPSSEILAYFPAFSFAKVAIICLQEHFVTFFALLLATDSDHCPTAFNDLKCPLFLWNLCEVPKTNVPGDHEEYALAVEQWSKSTETLLMPFTTGFPKATMPLLATQALSPRQRHKTYFWQYQPHYRFWRWPDYHPHVRNWSSVCQPGE